ncbi:DUF935 domain-containing protein [Alicyclobacillus fastidiosus]|uniref:DUF935 domain-containing protein n=1 Tax=Alicyclobacillus fastidiosus TaxID=392011 RepID=A0ABY6ZLS8_9BACL|nr:DUF935 family protein [Alicyclobacillus fastidiosus]WAH43548.1 DUF935 domain-containing protein [Alicyclobacillus fastidiosus]GMA59724.1 hypothetical protein GCM10025859_01640 [Alicyclobacillus fastidiosus]GMA65573.1 hypothetical protein GCM10025859_60130 [Alicyclobacillus fastidiosus]
MATPSKLVGQIGSQLYTTFILFDKAIANPDSANVVEYERMIDSDETVAAGIEFMILSALNKLDMYRNETNPQIETFVNECFEMMDGTLIEVCADILSGIWAGYSGTEIVYKPDGAKIRWDYLATYHPRTVFFNIDKETGRLDQRTPITQFRWFAGSPVQIPRNKSIIYSHNMRFGNWYGTSQLRRVRKNWLLKDPVLKMWLNGVDKFGTPLIAAMVPDGDLQDPDRPTQDDGSQNLISNIEYTMRLLSNIQNGTGLAMASGTGDQKADIKSLFAGGAGLGDAFDTLVSYLNKMILRGMLVPSLIFDDGKNTGSYALGQAHFDIYTIMLENIYKKLTETLLEQLVRPLVDMNFGPQKDYGEFPEREMSETDRNVIAGIFMQMVNAGFLDAAHQEDFDHVRGTLGFPERKIDPPPDPSKAAALMGQYNHYVRGQPQPSGGIAAQPAPDTPEAGAVKDVPT